MPEYRRYYLEHRPVFVTVVTSNRIPWLGEHADLLLNSMRDAKLKYPYRHLAHVVMSDHFHWMFEMRGSPNFSKLVAFVKRDVSWRLKELRVEGKWQNRFYDHAIRSQNDLDAHLDYIHFNPVKHSAVSNPEMHPYSSFKEWKNRGRYDSNWGRRIPENIENMDLE